VTEPRPLSRRLLLLAAPTMLALAASCTGAIRGLAPPPAASDPPLPGPWRLRIAIFEDDNLDLPFHTGMLIDAPEGRILYDPAGFWRDEGCSRYRDVHYPMDDAAAEDWLSRGGLEGLPGRWKLHLFETEVPAAVASQAHALALSRPPAPSLACAWSVAELLSELPGFQDIRPRFLTARLLQALQARGDLTYTQNP